jgi:hypothetical protein
MHGVKVQPTILGIKEPVDHQSKVVEQQSCGKSAVQVEPDTKE